MLNFSTFSSFSSFQWTSWKWTISRIKLW